MQRVDAVHRGNRLDILDCLRVSSMAISSVFSFSRRLISGCGSTA
jgi:hypothetical protein